MADDRKAVGGGWLTHTLHVWPSDEVIAQSAYWPVWWYQAYARAARQLADRVACCILGGLPDCPEPIAMELQPSGSLTFSVHLSGTTIEVLIWHFEGPDDPEPDAPGPDGGVRQRAADGLVLGLRGTGKEFSVAPFYDGLVPPAPVGRARLRPWTVRITTVARTGGSRGGRIIAASWTAATPGMAPPKAPQASYGERGSVAASGGTVWSATAGGKMYRSAPFAHTRPAIATQPEIKIEMRPSRWMDATCKKQKELQSVAYPRPELFSSEQPPVLLDAFSGSIHAPMIFRDRICTRNPPSTKGAHLRLN